MGTDLGVSWCFVFALVLGFLSLIACLAAFYGCFGVLGGPIFLPFCDFSLLCLGD